MSDYIAEDKRIEVATRLMDLLKQDGVKVMNLRQDTDVSTSFNPVFDFTRLSRKLGTISGSVRITEGTWVCINVDDLAYPQDLKCNLIDIGLERISNIICTMDMDFLK